MTSMYSQRGFSLTEIMVALVLGLLVTGTVMQIYMSSRQTYRVGENLARIHEDSILALEIMANSLRQAGYFGCGTRIAARKNDAISAFIVIANDIPQVYNGQVLAISGGDNAQDNRFMNPNPILNVSLNTEELHGVVNGTDAFTVQYAEAFTVQQPPEQCDGALTGTLGTVDPTGVIRNNNCDDLSLATDEKPGSILVVADCDNVHVFRAAPEGDSTQNTEGGIGTDLIARPYTVRDGDLAEAPEMSAPPEVMYFRSYTFYIREDGKSHEPSLFRLDNTSSGDPVALVEGVENMQVVYGVDGNADSSIDQYLDAASVTDWSSVMGVRIELTVRSHEDNLRSDSRTYSYGGEDDIVDRRITKTFSLTVNFRNRR